MKCDNKLNFTASSTNLDDGSEGRLRREDLQRGARIAILTEFMPKIEAH